MDKRAAPRVATRVIRVVGSGSLCALLLMAGAASGATSEMTNAAAASRPADAASGPRTLVQLERTILAFAQDGSRIAWVTHRSAVVVRDVGGSEATRIGSLFLPSLGYGCSSPRICGLTLAGDRALGWVVAEVQFKTLFTASLARHGSKKVETILKGRLVGPRGDGADLIYGIAWSSKGAGSRVTGGRVVRLIGDRVQQLRQIGAPALLDVSAGRLAVVPALRLAAGDIDAPVVGAPSVQIRDARTGRHLQTIELGGTPAAIALSSQLVAALIKPPTGHARIERYAVEGGRLLGRSIVPDSTAPGLDAALGVVVYRSGRVISMLDQRGTSHVLARASGQPLGLSIEGRRVAWAENVEGRGFVRALMTGP
jgi:hypothetical protein